MCTLAPISSYDLGYLFEGDSWRPESIATPFLVWLNFYWIWWIVGIFLWHAAFVYGCKAAEIGACHGLPAYPYMGNPVGNGEHFALTGGFENGKLSSTANRLVIRANSDGCACQPGRCGGVTLTAETRAFPPQLNERGVPELVWQRHMKKLQVIQKRYSKICDLPLRWSYGGLGWLQCPWYLKLKMAWASNCFGCCACCWRCCCCCECAMCCCFDCFKCCCPGAVGFIGLWVRFHIHFTVLRLICDCFATVLRLIWVYFDEQWHIAVGVICPLLPWARIDPFQHAFKKFLKDFNFELEPHGVTVKAFTFAQTSGGGERSGDEYEALSTLVFALVPAEAQILELEPVLQRGEYTHCQFHI